MVGSLMNDGLKMMWKEAVVAYLQFISRHLPGVRKATIRLSQNVCVRAERMAG
jgi:hypothetical protein